VILSRKNGFEGGLREQFTFSTYMEFVSRHYAAFLKGTKIRVVLRAYFTFSTYMEFVKWAGRLGENLPIGENYFIILNQRR